ncbi:MAG: single-strand DNA-binding protein [Lentimonas sp.]|jgi:single-strand DNA-binding protein
MASFNKVILIGNLTRDPELRVTANGNSICKLGLAVNRSYLMKDGERREETTFIDIDSFGKQAEVISKYMRKGRPLMVEGRLKLDQWESDGQKRSKLGVVLENFQFLGGRDDADSSSESGYEQSSPPVRSAPPPAKSESPETNFSNDKDTLDDDVPF